MSEIFGPTIQGEGRQVGRPCSFIRFAGCDYRCAWCDSLHAVLPEYVSRTPKMTEAEIINRTLDVGKSTEWVVFSGGNPVLLDLTNLVRWFHAEHINVMTETQGTVFHPWLADVDDLCISPKPPSSENMTDFSVTEEFIERCITNAIPRRRIYLKVVVFNDEDFAYARQVHAKNRDLDMFLSVGNSSPPHPDPTKAEDVPDGVVIMDALRKMAWLMEKTAREYRMRDVRVLPQMHLLAWGNARGR